MNEAIFYLYMSYNMKSKLLKINTFDSELGLLVQCLKLNGLWPYTDKYKNIKFLLCFIISLCGVLNGIFTIFNQKNNHDRILSTFQATLYIHTFTQRCVFKWNQLNFKIVFNYMNSDWQESNHLKTNDLNIMFNYVKKSRHVVKMIFITFFIAGFGKEILLFTTKNMV